MVRFWWGFAFGDSEWPELGTCLGLDLLRKAQRSEGNLY